MIPRSLRKAISEGKSAGRAAASSASCPHRPSPDPAPPRRSSTALVAAHFTFGGRLLPGGHRDRVAALPTFDGGGSKSSGSRTCARSQEDAGCLSPAWRSFMQRGQPAHVPARGALVGGAITQRLCRGAQSSSHLSAQLNRIFHADGPRDFSVSPCPITGAICARSWHRRRLPLHTRPSFLGLTGPVRDERRAAAAAEHAVRGAGRGRRPRDDAHAVPACPGCGAARRNAGGGGKVVYPLAARRLRLLWRGLMVGALGFQQPVTHTRIAAAEAALSMLSAHGVLGARPPAAARTVQRRVTTRSHANIGLQSHRQPREGSLAALPSSRVRSGLTVAAPARANAVRGRRTSEATHFPPRDRVTPCRIDTVHSHTATLRWRMPCVPALYLRGLCRKKRFRDASPHAVLRAHRYAIQGWPSRHLSWSPQGRFGMP